MSTLLILKFGAGSLAQGFPVALQIGPEGALPYQELNGNLPAARELKLNFEDWQQTYRRFDFSGAAAGRPLALKKQPDNRFSSLADCNDTAQSLAHSLNQWLCSPGFLPLRETWLAKVKAGESLRLVIQTQSLELQRLPWHQWDLLRRNSQAAVTLSTPNYERQPSRTLEPGVKLLALLGDSEGIDVERDRTLLESLPETTATFLIEPNRKQLNDQLWQEPWQVLFFAGHSASLGANAIGRMGINPNDSLTISELKYALRNAVQQGLQLAIFNSCDGLGLARELADLQIPQLIVMGEPVPDRVAQEFLKHFLTAYTSGLPLHLSVRKARTQLQALEAEFPNASWLPVVFQSLAATPPTWTQLAGTETLANPLAPALSTSTSTAFAPTTSAPTREPKPRWRKRTLATALGIGTAIAAATLGLRTTGLLQPFELKAYDRLLTLRPSEPPDDRLLIITVTEDDLAIQSDRDGGSLSDGSLLRILETLEPHEPAVIGLDIYRDRPVKASLPALADWLTEDPGFVSVCRMGDGERSDIAPPPEVSPDRLGFSDLLPDADGVHRRQLLAMNAAPDSSCATQFSLASALAIRYLGMVHGIALEEQTNGDWQLGQTHLTPLSLRQGGYQNADTWGYQTLLNYRNPGSPRDIANSLTLAQVFDGDFQPEQIQDRIILIGTIAESFKDYSKSPYSSGNEDIAGVLLQAQMTSQLVSAALDGRSPIRPVSRPWEIAWIFFLAWAGSLLALGIRQPRILMAAAGLLSVGAIAFAFILLAQASLWLTIVPALLALGLSALAVQIYGQKRWQ